MALLKKKKKSALAKSKEDPNSTYWKRKADHAWGAVIHAMGGGCVCDTLGDCKGPLEAHHLVTRGRVRTRHNPANGVLLCSYHHKWSKYCSPHMAPLEFAAYLQRCRPDIWDRFLEMRDPQLDTGETYMGWYLFLKDLYRDQAGKELD